MDELENSFIYIQFQNTVAFVKHTFWHSGIEYPLKRIPCKNLDTKYAMHV